MGGTWIVVCDDLPASDCAEVTHFVEEARWNDNPLSHPWLFKRKRRFFWDGLL